MDFSGPLYPLSNFVRTLSLQNQARAQANSQTASQQQQSG